jgi:hypothetical protein
VLFNQSETKTYLSILLSVRNTLVEISNIPPIVDLCREICSKITEMDLSINPEELHNELLSLKDFHLKNLAALYNQLTSLTFVGRPSISEEALIALVCASSKTLQKIVIRDQNVTSNFLSQLLHCAALNSLKIIQSFPLPVTTLLEVVCALPIQDLSISVFDPYTTQSFQQLISVKPLSGLELLIPKNSIPEAPSLLLQHQKEIAQLRLPELQQIDKDTVVTLLNGLEKLIVADFHGCPIDELTFIETTASLRHPTLELLYTPQNYAMIFSGCHSVTCSIQLTRSLGFQNGQAMFRNSPLISELSEVCFRITGQTDFVRVSTGCIDPKKTLSYNTASIQISRRPGSQVFSLSHWGQKEYSTISSLTQTLTVSYFNERKSCQRIAHRLPKIFDIEATSSLPFSVTFPPRMCITFFLPIAVVVYQFM